MFENALLFIVGLQKIKVRGTNVMPITAKITKKGQVTIPRKIREKLNSEVIEFDILESGVMIRPVKSVAGSLNSYVKKMIPFKEEREKAWEEIVREQYDEKTGRR